MYPRENNETFISFLFTSFHLAAPHRCPISFRDPDQPAPYTGWRESTSRLCSQQYIIGRIQFSRVLRGEVGIVGAFIRIFKALIEDFIGLKRRSWRNQKLMDSLNGFASYVPDFPSIFWRLVFLYGQRESTEKERRKEVTGIPFSWKLLLLNFPISSKLWDY